MNGTQSSDSDDDEEAFNNKLEQLQLKRASDRLLSAPKIDINNRNITEELREGQYTPPPQMLNEFK